MTALFTPESMAVFLARTILAVLFIFQGYDKLFRIGINRVTQTVYLSFVHTGIPRTLLFIALWLGAFIELGCGMLLLAGVFKYLSLSLLGINLLMVSVGLSISNPVWDMKLVFPRLLLLIFVLLFPDKHDVLTVSHLIRTFGP